MSPYFAVIRDSFHAALASRVLWIAFIAIWLLLGALSPIGYREDFTTTFRGRDFHNGTRLKAMLAQGLVDDEAKQTPAGRIAAAMPEDLVRQLKRVGDGDEVRIRLSVLADGLNECLDEESWYDEESWSSALRFRELRELEQLGENLDNSLRRRRARLRIEAGLPGVFETRSSRSIMLTYAGLDFPANFAVDKTRFVALINQYVIPIIIDWLMGFVLIFLGILVTASVIPDMLQPGSLHLLLSKSVSRTMLLLSKFAGGCSFFFLCVLQLVVGLYLIAGFRLDLWNLRLLWCIPVSVFLFSVFYGVSTLAGLVWRSPILAIGVTSIFGTICLVVGIIGGVFDEFVTRPQSIGSLAVAGDTMIGSTNGGGLIRFDRDTNRWVEILENNTVSGDRVIPPVALDSDTVVTAKVTGGRFNPFGSGALDLLVVSRQVDWLEEPSLRLPTATSSIYLAGDSVLAMSTGELAMVSQSNILRQAGSEETQASSKPPSGEVVGGWLEKLNNMMGVATEGFTSVLPDFVSVTPPRAVQVHPEGQWLIAMTRGRLLRLQRPQDSQTVWNLVADRTLDGEASLRGVIALNDELLLVARDEEPIQIIDAVTLEPLTEVSLPSSLVPVAAVGLGINGGFMITTSDGRARQVRPVSAPADENLLFELSDPLGIHEVETITFDSQEGKLFVVHHVDRVDILDVGTMLAEERIRPSLQSWRMVDRYLISPMRLLIPQTGELGDTIQSIVSGKSAVTIDDGSEMGRTVRYNIVRPVFSCGAFLSVMLAISCLYFKTRDF